MFYVFLHFNINFNDVWAQSTVSMETDPCEL